MSNFLELRNILMDQNCYHYTRASLSTGIFRLVAVATLHDERFKAWEGGREGVSSRGK